VFEQNSDVVNKFVRNGVRTSVVCQGTQEARLKTRLQWRPDEQGIQRNTREARLKPRLKPRLNEHDMQLNPRSSSEGSFEASSERA
jgi:hypothetical protein